MGGLTSAERVLDDENLDRLLSYAWGKTDIRPGQRDITRWLPVAQHLDDAGGVAGWLWDEWLPLSTRTVLEAALGGSVQARATAVFLAAVHDVGKATPAFALKQAHLAQTMAANGWPMPSGLSTDDLRRLPHGLGGHLIVARYLMEQGWSREQADSLAVVVGGHHGFMPSRMELAEAGARQYLLGEGPVWRAAQDRLVARAIALAGIDLTAIREHLPGTPAQALLTGIVVMADWIASDSRGFGLENVGRPFVPKAGRLNRGLAVAALPHRWRIAGFDDAGLGSTAGLADDVFGSRFPALAGKAMRPIQVAAIDAARSCDPHSLLIIEAPMGIGKTEAALLAAETLAVRTGAGGFGFFLPTQATSGAQFGRFVSWIEALTSESNDENVRRAVSLLHGKAWLDPVFSRLPRDTDIDPPGAQIFDDDAGSRATPYVHHWMSNRRTSPLSDGVVGTVDQLLTMALQSRHVALRHLGLAGKVVVIDEVHSYDAYMNVYLERALEWLGADGVPVILLSATLPADRRQRLMAAYRGTGSACPRKSSWRRQPDPDPVPEPSSAAIPLAPYPAITAVREGTIVTTAVEHSAHSTRVAITPWGDDDAGITDLLRESLEAGGCAAVIRNTVKRAQQTYRALVAEFGAEYVTLAHARFLSRDRAILDADLLARFGPGEAHRPERHIVIATQVIEQSLDLDFDVLITDIAPADLLLQRIGRVHRHSRQRPTPLRDPHCYVTGVDDWSHQPPHFAKAMGSVYADYDLFQAAALVLDHRGAIIPDDIPTWVQGAYGPAGTVPSHWSSRVEESRREREALVAAKELAAATYRLAPPSLHDSLVGWSNRSQADADDARSRAQVRDGDDTFDVIVGFRDRYGDVTVAPWHAVAGSPPVRVDAVSSDAAVAIAACSTRISARQLQSSGGSIDDLISECERDTPVTWADHLRLKGQLLAVLDVGPDGQSAHGVRGRAYLEYSQTEGLRISSTRAAEERRDRR